MDRWSYQTYYASGIGQERFSLTKSLWVTTFPQMKNFFVGKAGTDCPLTPARVAQILGLHPAKIYDNDPDNTYSILLEMWVNPNDLFRPSPNPEIKDHEAGLAKRVSEGT